MSTLTEQELLEMLNGSILVEEMEATKELGSFGLHVRMEMQMSPATYQHTLNTIKRHEPYWEGGEMNNREYEDPYDSWDEPEYTLNVDLGLPANFNALIYKDTKKALERIQKRKGTTMLYTTSDLTPDHILRSGNRTIVFWQDGTKTIVKRSAHDCPDDYMAFTAALAIKIFGSNSALKRMLEDKTYIQVKMANGKCKTTKKSDLYTPLKGGDD